MSLTCCILIRLSLNPQVEYKCVWSLHRCLLMISIVSIRYPCNTMHSLLSTMSSTGSRMSSKMTTMPGMS